MASVEEEEAPLESVSYDDEEDEDDDILKPVFTKKNSSPISKSSVIASSPLISPNYAADVTQESIEERGRSLVWIDGQIIQLIHAQTHHPIHHTIPPQLVPRPNVTSNTNVLITLDFPSLISIGKFTTTMNAIRFLVTSSTISKALVSNHERDKSQFGTLDRRTSFDPRNPNPASPS